MSSERVLLIGKKGCGKKTIQKSLYKLFPNLFTPNENNITCLDLSKKIPSSKILSEVTIPVFIISCERAKAKLHTQENYFQKLERALEKHAPDTILLILVHKKDQFVDPIQKRDFLATCAKTFRRKRGKALIVSTSAKDYSIKRAFSKILKIRGVLSLVAKRKIVPPTVKPPVPITGLSPTTHPAKPKITPDVSPIQPKITPDISPIKSKIPVVPSISDEKAEMPPIQPQLAVEAEDSGIQLEREMRSVDLTVQEEPEQVEEYESLEPSLPQSPPGSTPVSDEMLTREDFIKAARAEMEKIIEVHELEHPPVPTEMKQPTARLGGLGETESMKDFSEVVEEVKEQIDEGLLDQLHPTKELTSQMEAVESLDKGEVIADQIEEAALAPFEAILFNKLTETEISEAYQLLEEDMPVEGEVGSPEEARSSMDGALEDMTDLFEWSEQLEEDVSVEAAEDLSRAVALVEFLEDIKKDYNLNSVGLIDLESREEIVMIGGAPKEHLNIQKAALEAMKHAEVLNPIQIWERWQSNKNLGVIRKLTQTVAVIYIGTEQACETLHKKIEGVSDQIKTFL